MGASPCDCVCSHRKRICDGGVYLDTDSGFNIHHGTDNMPPRQVMQKPCGCVDELWGWKEGPFQGQEIYTMLCPQHLVIVNNGGSTQQPGMRPQQVQIPTTTGGIPSNPFVQFQTAGFGHPFQMPPQGGHTGMPQQAGGR